MFVDRFSAGLDDLTRKQQACTQTVLGVLHRIGRFSCFEASDNMTIATTVTSIINAGYVETKDAGYPWTKVKLTATGLALLGLNVVEMRTREALATNNREGEGNVE